MMMLKDKTVAIVGGGPGGLTLARLLQLSGIRVNVYERDVDKNARVQGSPLDLHEESGLAALKKAGLLTSFKTHFLKGADRKSITDEKAFVHYSDHHEKPEEDFDSVYFRPEIDRGTLRRILLESLEQETVIWNAHFIRMEVQDKGWILHFKNGNTAYADLVVAADGANSKIRPYITDAVPFYSGITMLEGTVLQSAIKTPRISTILKGGKIMAFGTNRTILMGQKENDEIGYYLGFRAPEFWSEKSGLNFSDNKQVLKWFQLEYPEWDEIWYELIENTIDAFIPRPIYCMPLNEIWKAPHNVTLLGDAAHVMPPFAGEGVNMAMLDALELSTLLTSEKNHDPTEVFKLYEKKMKERASKAALESLENGEKMHAGNALENMLHFFENHENN